MVLKVPWEGVRSRMIREPEDLPVKKKQIIFVEKDIPLNNGIKFAINRG